MVKQPEDGWCKGRFLGINWDAGDSLTYFIEPNKDTIRSEVLTRSAVRPISTTSPNLDKIRHSSSGENVNNNNNNVDDRKEDDYSSQSENENNNNTNNNNGIILPPMNFDNTKPSHSNENPDDENYDENNENDESSDIDNNTEYHLPMISEQDDAMDLANIKEEIEGLSNADEEDYEFHHIESHRWECGILIFNTILRSGKSIELPFNMIKRDRPIETAKYIKIHVVENNRNGKYGTWSKNILKNAQRTVRRMHRYYNTDRVHRINLIRVRKISRNKRNQQNKSDIKCGIKVPINVRQALLFDKENKNTLWADAIMKEMTALYKAEVFKFYPPNHKIDRVVYQWTKLRMIFDVKKEDLRRKARLVAGGHLVDSSMYETYASVVQVRTIRLLMTIAMNENLSFVTGDISNAFVHAETKEKIWTIAGPEFNERIGSIVILNKALYGLATSARAWNLELGDTVREMGFKPTRDDSDLWIKRNAKHDIYE